jgi:hypothetical protein
VPEEVLRVPRTVEERIEIKHAEGQSRFKKWRRFVTQVQEPSPLSETGEKEEELDSGPPSDEEDDGPPTEQEWNCENSFIP